MDHMAVLMAQLTSVVTKIVSGAAPSKLQIDIVMRA